MTLDQYIEKHGPAAKRAIAKKTGLRWATIHDIAEGRSIPQPRNAVKISKATGGEVSVAALLGLKSTAA